MKNSENSKQVIAVDKPFSSAGPSVDGVKMKTGETTEKVRQRREKMRKTQEKDTSNWTDVDRAIDYLSQFLTNDKSYYSETYKIKENGTFDYSRIDGSLNSNLGNEQMASVLRAYADTPEKFYKLAREIQDVRSDWSFEFDMDLSTREFKYTCSKT